MRRAAAVAASVLLLAACSGPQYPTSAPTPATPQPAPRAHVRPPPPPRVSVRDQCGAAALQALVGRPRTEIPVPIEPNRQRVACTSCPVTLDYNPARLNFFFDAETGIIKQVRCG